MALEPGDVIQLGDRTGQFYHSLLVTGFSGQEILVATHSSVSYTHLLVVLVCQFKTIATDKDFIHLTPDAVGVQDCAIQIKDLNHFLTPMYD